MAARSGPMDSGSIVHIDYDLFNAGTEKLIETTREDAAKEHDLHDVEILGVLGQEEEAVIVKHLPRCGAGFVVAAAVNVMRGSEPRDPAVGPHSAGDAHLGVDEVLPIFHWLPVIAAA